MLTSELFMLYFFEVLRSGDNLTVLMRVMLFEVDSFILDLPRDVPLIDLTVVVSLD